MIDENRSGSSGWMNRLRERAGWMQKPVLSTDASVQGGINSFSRPSKLHSEGARQAYERSLAKEKERAGRGKERSLLLDIPLTELPVVVIDLETTGFEPYADEIISIGAKKIVGTKWEQGEDCEWYELLNPGIHIPSHIELLTGITNEEVTEARSVSDGLRHFVQFVDKRLIIAHASGHDKAFLRTALWRYHRHTWKYRMLDTMLVAKWLYPKQRELDLDTLAQMHGISIVKRHHALYDARTAGELWMNFVDQALAKRVMTLREMYMYLSQY
ncbi:exonuclease domain-containing protein [Paenibacillus sp. 1001270B_150601_E10]|uniref:exonuclease domain-containing protein n=1 Tax=Paenibacillus sp. 1001270B_150601_E10 TaxID=2787079 RepID=UPI00189F726B|nr:exonuclease domain-containing protein [Paenibacillus sp. 1001270B_150601_E10]